MMRIGARKTAGWPVLLGAWLMFLAAQSLGFGPAQAAPASSYDPARLRQVLLNIHGYDKAALEAASTDVSEILMTLANDPEELMVVRRQAVKGLRLYPEDGVMNFIEQQAPSAPRTLKRLYLSSLNGFAATHPARVSALVAANLEDADVSVRLDAVRLSDRLGATPQVKSILQSRLSREPDAQLRVEIQRRLGAQK
jgi:hypothetical protein